MTALGIVPERRMIEGLVDACMHTDDAVMMYARMLVVVSWFVALKCLIDFCFWLCRLAVYQMARCRGWHAHPATSARLLCGFTALGLQHARYCGDQASVPLLML
jgi:hypothetical protein